MILIENQKKELRFVIEKLISECQNKWEKHKEEFKMEKLYDIVSKAEEYCSKYVLNLDGQGPPNIGQVNFKIVKDSIAQFKTSYETRGIPIVESESLNDIIVDIDYVIIRIEENNLIGKDRYIFAELLRYKLMEMKDIAKDIDNDYNS